MGQATTFNGGSMLSEVRQRKFAGVFSTLDTNGDGFLEASDFEAVYRTMVQRRGFQPGSSAHDRVQSTIMSQWQAIQASADSDQDGRVTLDEYLQFIGALYQSPDGVTQFAVASSDQLIMTFDSNGDGCLSLAEFRDAVDGWRIPADTAEAIFRHLDKNGDGQVSHDELLTLVSDFYFNDDPGTSMDLWGTLA
jgi:Ca2+-binding EF-hand superfamily protein